MQGKQNSKIEILLSTLQVSTMLPSATVAMNVTDEMPDRWGFRCGWSLGSVQHAYGYVLGDQENTWAYSVNSGHKGTASRFIEWGRPALPGDVITCLLDLHRRCMEFLVNGESCGENSHCVLFSTFDNRQASLSSTCQWRRSSSPNQRTTTRSRKWTLMCTTRMCALRTCVFLKCVLLFY